MPTVNIRFATQGGSQVDQDVAARAAILASVSARANAEAKAQAQARRVIERGANAESAREQRKAANEAVQIEADATKKRIREIIARKNGTEKAEQTVRAAIVQTTRLIEAESGKRIVAGSREAHEIERLVARNLASRQKADKEAAKSAETAEKSRIKAAESSARQVQGIFKTAYHAVGNAMGVAQSVHGEIQGARLSRAQANRTLNGALIQAGVTSGTEINATQSRIAAHALQQGIKYEDVIAAVNESQSTFNSLGAGTAGERAGKLEDILKATTFANDMHSDPIQIAKLQGMLAQDGITGEAQQSLIQRATQMSFNGSVEIGDTLKQGLGPMKTYINTELQKLGPNASKEDRDKVYGTAMMDTLAQSQLQAASGNTVRFSGTRFSSLDTVLQNNNTQDLLGQKLFTKFKKGPEREALNEAFTKRSDGTYSLSKEMQNPIAFAKLVSSVFKGDGTAMQNLFGAKGAGFAQALQKPDAKLLAGMMSVGKDGKPMYEAIADMVANSKMSPDFIKSAHEITQNEDQTKLNKADEERAQALTGNTSALVSLSNKIADFMKANPLTSTLLGSLPGVLGGGPANLAGKAAEKLTEMGGGGATGLVKGVAGPAAALAAGLLIGDELTKHLGKNTNAEDNRESIGNPNTWKVFRGAVFGDEAAGNQGVYQTRANTGLEAIRYAKEHAKEFAGLDPGKQAEVAKIISRIGLDTDTIAQLGKVLGDAVAANPPKVSVVDAEHAAAVSNTGGHRKHHK